MKGKIWVQSVFRVLFPERASCPWAVNGEHWSQFSAAACCFRESCSWDVSPGIFACKSRTSLAFCPPPLPCIAPHFLHHRLPVSRPPHVAPSLRGESLYLSFLFHHRITFLATRWQLLLCSLRKGRPVACPSSQLGFIFYRSRVCFNPPFPVSPVAVSVPCSVGRKLSWVSGCAEAYIIKSIKWLVFFFYYYLEKFGSLLSLLLQTFSLQSLIVVHEGAV